MYYSVEEVSEIIFNIANIKNKSTESKIIKILNDWKNDIDKHNKSDKEMIQRQAYDNGWALGYRVVNDKI
jgi:hypothetical protein